MKTPDARITDMFNEELASVGASFDRKPIAGLYEAYKQYVDAGNYPYVQNVADYFMDTFSIDPQYAKQLSHEAYLCNQEARKDKDLTRAKAMQDKGYFKATRDTLEKGKTYLLVRNSDSMFGGGLQAEQKVRCSIDADNNVFLMPMRNTRRGYMLSYGCEYWVKAI